MQASEVNLDAEMLRILAHAAMKEAEPIWHLNESQICGFFQNYTSLPMSPVKPDELVGCEGVRIVKSENKVYLGEVMYRKKHGKGINVDYSGISIYRDGRIYEGYFFNN